MPVTVLVNFKAKSGQRDAVVDFLKNVQPGAIEAGCHSIAVHTVVGDADTVVEIEYWDSQEAHEAFVAAAVEAKAFDPLQPLLAGPFEVSYLHAQKKTEA